MADRKLVHRAMGLGLLLALCSGCEDTNHTVRLLDSVCGTYDYYYDDSATPDDPCLTIGDATKTTGLSGDSVGFRIGPNGGEVHLPLARIRAANNYAWSLDVLAAASQPEGTGIYRTISWGSCGADCPADPNDAEAQLPDDDYHWVQVGAGLYGANFSNVPDDAVVIFRGRNLDILDIRTPGEEEYVFY